MNNSPRKTDPQHPPLVLVDGSSYLYRAFHALPPLTNSKGAPTGAIYGVINMLRKLISDIRPSLMAVVFDAKGKTFRDDLFAQYKAHRPSMPDELQVQVEPLRAVIQAMGIPMLIIDGVEADDVIGTLAHQACIEGLATLISTMDKDMAQLVNEQVTLINTMTNTLLDPAGVVTKFGVPPDLITDYLALIGDTSDNIPGIPMVGPKTATKWLKEFGSLTSIIENAHKISGKAGDNLRQHLSQLPLAKQLATIKIDVPLAIQPRALIKQAPDTLQLRKCFEDLEFKTWLAQLTPESTPPASLTPAVTSSYVEVTTASMFKDFLSVGKKNVLALYIDISKERDLRGLSLHTAEQQSCYIPLAALSPDNEPASLHAMMAGMLRNPAVEKIVHNLKQSLTLFKRVGFNIAAAHDVMLESYVLNSVATDHTLAAQSNKYLNTALADPADSFQQGAVNSSQLILRLHECLWPQLTSEAVLRDLYEKVELPLAPILAAIEQHGVLIDIEKLNQQSTELAGRIAELERQAYDEAGEQFNLGSPKQIQEILFGKLGLPVMEKTPTGQPSTGESVLQELAISYPLPRLILEHRALSKLKSTYTDKLPNQINAETGRVHTSYHQAITATGRLSSSDPNLQNIPIRTAEGRKIRQAFIAPPGYLIVSADYSQIELRIMAHLSGDEGLVSAFQKGEDIHLATAAEIFGLTPASVTAEQRRSAKAINFGLIYGMSSFGLAKQLGIPRNAAQEYVDLYFSRYPGVKKFMDRMRLQVHKRGYVETVLGRRLYLPDIHSRNAQRRQYAERAAINAPMQGTAADIIKIAMIKVNDAFKQYNVNATMVMQVHDELVFEVAENNLDEAQATIRACMCSAAQLSVPLLVDIGLGKNWDEAH